MPTIAEIREEYPQYEDMSDTQLADALYGKFYSDMPRAEFDSKIGLAPKEPEPSFMEKLGTTWPAQLAKSVYGAVTLYGDGMQGKVDPLSDEAIRRSFDAAGLVSPLSAGARGASVKAAQPVQREMTEGQNVAAAAQRLGVDIPRAASSDRMSVQRMGQAVSNIPVGGDPLKKASQRAIGQLDDAARNVQQGYGSGSVARAGSALRDDVTTHITDTLGGRVQQRYDAVDALVSPDVRTPLTSTANTARSILQRRQNAAIGSKSQAVSQIEEAINRPEGLNYEGVKTLRTYIGEMLNGGSPLPADISQAELKQIYGSLTDDLRRSVSHAGGSKALAAFERANTYAAQVAKEREALNSILGRTKSDEGIFESLKSMAGQTSRADVRKLYQVRAAVSDETWNEMASGVIQSMGRDADGNFTPDRFLTAWGKLSDAGKRALFRSKGSEGLAESLEDIATVSRRFKQLNQYANPSGTAQNMLGAGAATGIFFEPVSVLSTLVGSRMASSYLSRPATAKQVAQWAKAVEVAQRSPSPAARTMLANRSKALSLTIANDMGAPEMARQIAVQLSGGSVKLAAEDERQGDMKGSRVKGDGVDREPRRLLPNEA